jgi:cyanobactin maturation PatA/PatG family protease
MKLSSEENTLAMPGLNVLWAETVGHPDICLAVLDGPVDLSHPGFEGANLTLLESLVSGVADSGAASQHGTHVASVIFGQPGSPIHGIAPGCRGLIIPIFRSGAGDSLVPCSQLDLARAILLAVQHGANVINLSGGQFEPTGQAHPLLADAVRFCAKHGILIVAAAGNDGCDCLHIPAALDAVLAVGAMDWQGTPLEISNWGEAYQRHGILALGQDVSGAMPGGGVVTRSGTSFATAMVSGVTALLLSLQLKRSERPDPRAVRHAILTSAIGCDQQPVANCRRLLAGRLNIVGALHQLTQGGTVEMSDQPKFQDVDRIPAQEIVSDALEVSTEPALMPCVKAAEMTPVSLQAATGQLPDLLGAKSSAVAAAVATDDVRASAGPSGCACGGSGSSSGSPTLVYALGQLGYDFGTEARRDSFVQLGVANPNDPQQLLAYLEKHPSDAAAFTWTLNQETVPIYAIQPQGAFAAHTYEMFRQFLNDQIKQAVDRVSIPGVMNGQATLLNGQTVPVVSPASQGMYSWSTAALVKAVLGDCPSRDPDRNQYNLKAAAITNFLDRVYYESRNLGVTPQDRAMNYAATNAFQVGQVFTDAVKADMQLDTIGVERSPICRPDSNCWDVALTFFNPAKRLEQARIVYRFTVDVSDVIPVTIGKVRNWYVY